MTFFLRLDTVGWEYPQMKNQAVFFRPPLPGISPHGSCSLFKAKCKYFSQAQPVESNLYKEAVSSLGDLLFLIL